MPNFAAMQAIDQTLPGNATPADPYANAIDVGGAAPLPPGAPDVSSTMTAPASQADAGHTIHLPVDSPLTRYAGQSLHVLTPDALPPGVTLPPGTNYPVRLNFGATPQTSFPVVAAPATPAAVPSPAATAPPAVVAPVAAPGAPDPLAKFRLANMAAQTDAAPVANANQAQPDRTGQNPAANANQALTAPLAAPPAAQPASAAAPTLDPLGMQAPIDNAMHAMTFGADQVVAPAFGATVDAGLRAVQGMPQAWQDDYNRLQQKQRDELAQFHADHPVGAAASGLAGGIASGGVVAPLFGTAPAGADLGLQAINYARNVAAGAGTGFVSGFGEGQGGTQQRLQSGIEGAKFGAALPAAVPAIAAVAAPTVDALGTAAGKVLAAPAKILSPAARTQSVANTLGRDVTAGQVASSPVGPLDLAQATGNPAIAGKVDYALGSVPEANTTANALRTAQRSAVVNQIGKVGRATDRANASDEAVTALRAGHDVLKGEENHLWTVPELAKEKVTVDPIKSSVRQAVAAMDPEVAATMSARLRGIVNRIEKMSQTTIRDLNVHRSDLQEIVRTATDPQERAQARALSKAFLEGMDSIPEIAGRPAAATGMVKLEEGASKGNVVPEAQAFGRKATPVIAPEVAPNPALKAAYDTARAYTRQLHSLTDRPEVAPLFKAIYGEYKKDASEGAKQLLNLANGTPERPENLSQLADLVEQAKSQPKAAQVASDMRDAIRAHFATSLLDAAKLNEGQRWDIAGLQQLLQRNLPWIQKNNIFDAGQVTALKDLLDYVRLLRAPDLMNVQGGSPTVRRLEAGKTFINSIMSPWLRHALAFGTVGEGFTHGGVGGVVGSAAAGALEHFTLQAEAAMRTLMAHVLLDSKAAADLLRSAKTSPKALAPQTKALFKELAYQVGAEQAGQLTGGAAPEKTTNLPLPAMQ
jgi:hypothetical protein